MNQTQSVRDVTIVDGASLYGVAEAIADRYGLERITVEYLSLKRVLDRYRIEGEWRPATMTQVLLAQDPSSEGQQRFRAMLERSGFVTDASNYRNVFVSLPPGRNQGEFGGDPISSFASRIAYIAGLLARHKNPQLLVVSHSFELFAPLEDLARRIRPHGGRVGIAFFGSLLDYRWKTAGVFNTKNIDHQGGIDFYDLDEDGEDLVGVDLLDLDEISPEPSRGANLSQF